MDQSIHTDWNQIQSIIHGEGWARLPVGDDPPGVGAFTLSPSDEGPQQPQQREHHLILTVVKKNSGYGGVKEASRDVSTRFRVDDHLGEKETRVYVRTQDLEKAVVKNSGGKGGMSTQENTLKV